MKVLLQRVSQARVEIEGEVSGQIGAGLLILLGVEQGDTTEQMQALMEKCLNYRIFADQAGKMNLSVKDVKAEILLVSQFTLCASTGKGMRPSFSKAGAPKLAETLYNAALEFIESELGSVQSGRFAANMQVHLVNDGPVTFLLES